MTPKFHVPSGSVNGRDEYRGYVTGQPKLSVLRKKTNGIRSRPVYSIGTREQTRLRPVMFLATSMTALSIAFEILKKYGGTAG